MYKKLKILAALLLISSGCGILPKRGKHIAETKAAIVETMTSPEFMCELESTLLPQVIELAQVRERTKTVVRNLSWIQTAMVVGAICGLGAILLPIGLKKFGGPLLILSIAGYAFATGAKSMEFKYDWVAGILVVVAGVALIVVAIWRYKTVIHELVKGGEILKRQDSKFIKAFEEAHRIAQKSPITKNVVKAYQKKINGDSKDD